ncbi:MAG: universal stress protein [Dehalococcoidia bacterium]
MKVLLALDGSTFAESAIPATQRFAQTPDTELHVITVVEPRWADTLVNLDGEGVAGIAWLRHQDEDAETAAGLPPDIERLVARYLEDVSHRFSSCTVRPVLRVSPYPAEQIAAYAQAHDIDIVVMATHGRSGFNRLLHGSVASEVLRAGVAPVVLVRPNQQGA